MFSQTLCVHPLSVFLHMQPSIGTELVPINKVWRCLKMTASTVKQNTVIKYNYTCVDPAHIQRKTLKGTINLSDFILMPFHTICSFYHWMCRILSGTRPCSAALSLQLCSRCHVKNSQLTTEMWGEKVKWDFNVCSLS